MTHEPRSASLHGRQIVSNALFLAGIGTAVVVCAPFYAVASLGRRLTAGIHSPNRLRLHSSAGR